jgi:hypothetical protein
MPQLFIIAGLPGIGKSTNGKKFIQPTLVFSTMMPFLSIIEQGAK